MSKFELIYLNEKIGNGMYAKQTPLQLIKSKDPSAISYLLNLRLGNSYYEPKSFQVDLHHVLDNLIRNNAQFKIYATKYTETDYNLWLAEKRLERKKAEIQREEKTKRKREEIVKFQEEQRLKDLAAKQHKEEYLAKKAHEIELLKRLEQDRQDTYSTSWGTW